MPAITGMSAHANPIIPKGKIWDSAYEKHPTLMKLIEKGESQSGGTQYQPVNILTKDTGGAYYALSSTASVNVPGQTLRTGSPQYAWKGVINDVRMTQEEDVVAEDSEYVRVRAKEARLTQGRERHLDLLAAGAINGDLTSEKPEGITFAMDPAQDLGGIAGSGGWLPQTITAATVLSGMNVIDTQILTCTIKDWKPNLAPTTQTLFQRVKDICGMGTNYEYKGSDFKGGYQKINWNGLEIYMDRDIPSGYMPIFPLEVVHLFKHSRYWQKTTDFQTPNEAGNLYVVKNGAINSIYIMAYDVRRPIGGFMALS